MKKIKELTNDPATYVESIGRYDKGELAEIIKKASEGTVLRVCLWRR